MCKHNCKHEEGNLKVAERMLNHQKTQANMAVTMLAFITQSISNGDTGKAMETANKLSEHFQRCIRTYEKTLGAIAKTRCGEGG